MWKKSIEWHQYLKLQGDVTLNTAAKYKNKLCSIRKWNQLLLEAKRNRTVQDRTSCLYFFFLQDVPQILEIGPLLRDLHRLGRWNKCEKKEKKNLWQFNFRAAPSAAGSGGVMEAERHEHKRCQTEFRSITGKIKVHTGMGALTASKLNSRQFGGDIWEKRVTAKEDGNMAGWKEFKASKVARSKQGRSVGGPSVCCCGLQSGAMRTKNHQRDLHR